MAGFGMGSMGPQKPGFQSQQLPPGYGSVAPPPGYGSYGYAPQQPQPPPGYASTGGMAPFGMQSMPVPQMNTDQLHYYNQISQQELNQMWQWFQAVDKDRSGRISAQELSSMNFGGLKFSMETSRLLIKVFDRNRNGEIDFQEYASLHKFIASMHQAFQMYDRDRSGTIEIGEAQLAVQQGGFMLSPQTMTSVFQRFLIPGKQGLTLENFMCLCAFLGMARSAFSQLDTTRSGWIHLNLDQFILVTSSLG